MRYIITICFIHLITLLHASDTLTRAQVYNFNIGDTLDYKYVSHTYDVYNQYPPTYTQSYTRYVIQSAYLSPDSLRGLITRKRVYPLPVVVDSIVLHTPGLFEVYQDTGYGWSSHSGNAIIIDTALSFWGVNTNYISYYQGYYTEAETYAPGFGCILSTKDGGTGVRGGFDDTTSLIYYSGQTGTWGTPYSSFPTSLSFVNSNRDISIYPNPVKDHLFISGVTEEGTVEIYDAIGQKVYSSMIDADHNIVSVSNSMKGVYMCKVIINANLIMQTKIILE